MGHISAMSSNATIKLTKESILECGCFVAAKRCDCSQHMFTILLPPNGLINSSRHITMFDHMLTETVAFVAVIQVTSFVEELNTGER